MNNFHKYSPEYIVNHINNFFTTKDNKVYPVTKEDIYASIEDKGLEAILYWCKEFDIPFIEEKWNEQKK